MNESLETASPESQPEAQRKAKASLLTARSYSPRAAIAFSALAAARWLREILADLFRPLTGHCRDEEPLDATFVTFEGVARDALVPKQPNPNFR